MRITKEKAELVAKKLTEKKYNEWEDTKKELKDYVKEIALSKVPQPVFDMEKEYPDYVCKESRIEIQGEGITNHGLKYHYLSEEIIYSGKEVHVTKKQSNKIQKLNQKRENLYSEFKQLKREIENAVYNLRTYKKCEAEFPEAFKYLPKENITTALQVNIQDLRNKLK